MYKIKKIKLSNLRGFRNLELDISNEQKKPRNRTLIIGTNGTCKTTLLRAIIFGVSDYQDTAALLAEDNGFFVRQNSRESTIEVEVFDENTDDEPINIFTSLVERNGKDVVSKKSYQGVSSKKSYQALNKDKVFICSYGAGRSVEGPEYGKDFRIIDANYSLFNYETYFMGSELTLRRLEEVLGKDEYVNSLKKIVQLMGLNSHHKIQIEKGGGVSMTGPYFGFNIPIQGWADGYRLTFNMIVDLYGWAMKANNLKLDGRIEGILIVDEIEQHLHPSIQAYLLPHLNKFFPDLQIFATTHSPLVTLGSDPEELVVMRRNDNEIILERNIPDYRGFSVEDLLSDEDIFNTQIYSPKTTNLLKNYHDLLKKVNKSDSELHHLTELANSLRELQIPVLEKDPLYDKLAELRRSIEKIKK